MSSIMDNDWELVDFKEEVPRSPAVKAEHEMVMVRDDTMESGGSGTSMPLSTSVHHNEQAFHKEEAGTSNPCDTGFHNHPLTPKKEAPGSSMPTLTSFHEKLHFREHILTIILSCLESQTNYHLGSHEKAGARAESQTKVEKVRELALATEIYLKGLNRALQSLAHSRDYKLLELGDQELARAEVRKLFESERYDGKACLMVRKTSNV